MLCQSLWASGDDLLLCDGGLYLRNDPSTPTRLRRSSGIEGTRALRLGNRRTSRTEGTRLPGRPTSHAPSCDEKAQRPSVGLLAVACASSVGGTARVASDGCLDLAPTYDVFLASHHNKKSNWGDKNDWMSRKWLGRLIMPFPLDGDDNDDDDDGGVSALL